ncbi:UNVERIFIED_CONTAM: hypothetical protein K2H54_012887 [Gekko kuhli]
MAAYPGVVLSASEPRPVQGNPIQEILHCGRFSPQTRFRQAAPRPPPSEGPSSSRSRRLVRGPGGLPHPPAPGPAALASGRASSGRRADGQAATSEELSRLSAARLAGPGRREAEERLCACREGGGGGSARGAPPPASPSERSAAAAKRAPSLPGTSLETRSRREGRAPAGCCASLPVRGPSRSPRPKDPPY